MSYAGGFKLVCYTSKAREKELDTPESLLRKIEDNDSKEELAMLVGSCERCLKDIDVILGKHNALSDEERSGRKLWQKVRFGNGKAEDLRDQRGQLCYYTQALALYLNLYTLGSMGRVEKQMDEADGDLKELRPAVKGKTAYLMSTSREGSVLSTYLNDDKALWREFRRGLVKDGLRSSSTKYKAVITGIKDLGSQGVLDEVE